ncbi:MAG: hypothetical protein PHH31_07335 [Acidaminococcaceae bacterium]|nr:hypothetical protein [Acidaminococcaceae bacterium]MDD4721483.1 hypothetical protein [Acidaminococcaceae bacterium]
MENKQRMLVRGALLLALAVVAQQLRLVLPLPTLVTSLVIGTIVNATLVLAVRYTGLSTAVVMCAALPVIAFLQGHLPLVLLIPIVFIGNFVLVVFCNKFWRKHIFIIAPIAKASVMYLSALLLFRSLAINTALAKVFLIAMGWPQFVTAVLGILLAKYLMQKIDSIK